MYNMYSYYVHTHSHNLSLTHTHTQLVESACSEGRLQVLKLLLSIMTSSSPLSWLEHTMTSLEKLDHTNTSKRVALTQVARYAFNIDPTMAMSAVVRFTDTYPKASLYLLSEFCTQNDKSEHFMMTGVSLTSLPTRWIQDSLLTHINLSNNILTSLPQALFQLSLLRSLNLSHNSLQTIPSVLKWNCPKLRELDLSFNHLTDQDYFILVGRKPRDLNVDKNPPNREDQRKHITAAQRLLRLTGYNLYPCLCALTRVNINNNASLTQVSYCVFKMLFPLSMLYTPHAETFFHDVLSYCLISMLIVQLHHSITHI